MGYFINYSVPRLTILASNEREALQAINALHTDEALEKNARGGRYPHKDGESPRQYKWYSWVTNPKSENGFVDLKEAFDAWAIIDTEADADYDINKNFIVDGYYSNKWGQQEVLLKAIAPYTEDVLIEVRGEDGELWAWEIRNGKFIERNGRVVYD